MIKICLVLENCIFVPPTHNCSTFRRLYRSYHYFAERQRVNQSGDQGVLVPMYVMKVGNR